MSVVDDCDIAIDTDCMEQLIRVGTLMRGSPTLLSHDLSLLIEWAVQELTMFYSEDARHQAVLEALAPKVAAFLTPSSEN